MAVKYVHKQDLKASNDNKEKVENRPLHCSKRKRNVVLCTHVLYGEPWDIYQTPSKKNIVFSKNVGTKNNKKQKQTNNGA